MLAKLINLRLSYSDSNIENLEATHLDFMIGGFQFLNDLRQPTTHI